MAPPALAGGAIVVGRYDQLWRAGARYDSLTVVAAAP